MKKLKNLRIGDIFSYNKTKYVLETKRKISITCSPIYNRHIIQLMDNETIVQFNYRYTPYKK